MVLKRLKLITFAADKHNLMKKIIFIAGFAALMVAAVSCARFSNRGEVDRPFIEAANQHYFSVEKVVLTDSSTSLHAVVHYMPGQWIEIADSSRIIGNAKEYFLESIDGIESGKRVTMPDSA